MMVSNYGPKPLLSFFSKILKNCVRLFTTYQEHCKVLCSHQFGFRNSSYNHALISLTESIKSTSDNKSFGYGIFLDLQKAFNTVNQKFFSINWNTMAFVALL